MSNMMFVTCRHHPTHAESFLLASRGDGVPHEAHILHNKLAPQPEKQFAKAFEKWLKVHAKCGGTLDHFTVSYSLPKDHDVVQPNTTQHGVKAALTVVK